MHAITSALWLALSLTGTVAAQDSTQYWHERYHGLLSMAAYGPYEQLCPQTFTRASLHNSFPNSNEDPWTVLQKWGPTESGMEGFVVQIPEMDKVVMVFKGIYGWQNFNMTPTPIDAVLGMGGKCAGCTAHAGALQAYLEAKEATNDWAVVKQAVTATGHQWSLTGHDFGGMVSQIAALDLGWRGLAHWTHSHGSAAVFNPAAAAVYNQLFQGEASQRTVANKDPMPGVITTGEDYQHVLSGFYIWGTNQTYGMNYASCFSNPQSGCASGNNLIDHYFYYTPVGRCGGADQSYNSQLQSSFLASQSSSYYAADPSASATSSVYSSFGPPTPTTTSSSSSSSPTGAATTGPAGATTTGSGTSGSSRVVPSLLAAAVLLLGWSASP